MSSPSITDPVQGLTPPLARDLASRFARIALGHVTREYPNKLDHVLTGPAEAQCPRALHPIFYGSFDWHSCVHGYWLLASLLARVPDLPEAAAIHALFDTHITPAHVVAECAYLARPASAGFERPYGWAWLLKLQSALAGTVWGETLRPLATTFADRFKTFLPKATYPVRNGSHASTAFAVRLALDYADSDDPDLAGALRHAAHRWYGNDQGAVAWEPSGDDFLSPTLMEAACMARCDPGGFAGWFDAFLPDVTQGHPASLFTPATVSDRSDGKIAHLDGLNLSRAWCWREIAAALPQGHPACAIMRGSAATHLAASLPFVAGDYMGEHWLASFALLALG